MAAAYDIQSDENGDLLIFNNDLVYGLSDNQHIEDTMVASPLSWKQFPADGVNIELYLNSSGKQQEIQRNTKQQLMIDGYSTVTTVVTYDQNGTLKVTPNAQRI